ncbi:hypothetical protein SAMD00019534_078490 [Acytostelium subglobosum LB1]|uniref:hypothetical protein n=1 Tax=Acytostelium subglobosum LB1 TaxID=1410327 RepID=UPI0006450527|nr:hypothetical protein SAMD00019534_078490 [Acytostelium subglobosum LB1]GAM24674.1 hypothetical protein SAMD00019534_078490 [Acytostelium subglobosum LB1]|eukprot:XP_012752343.1 hypothetical protein SAMD00019534_078490 [Acytostelium subglobosum LB1]
MAMANMIRKSGLEVESTPLLLCGDFNNGPTQKTYTLLSDGHYLLDSFKLSHPFKLTSVYNHRPTGEPPFTCVTRHFKGNIDQIWKTPHFNIKSILEIGDHYPPQLPSTVDPSDHIMLMADLIL